MKTSYQREANNKSNNYSFAPVGQEPDNELGKDREMVSRTVTQQQFRQKQVQRSTGNLTPEEVERIRNSDSTGREDLWLSTQLSRPQRVITQLRHVLQNPGRSLSNKAEYQKNVCEICFIEYKQPNNMDN